MKTKIISGIIFISLFFIGCSGPKVHNIIYEGQGTNWSGIYNIINISGQKHESTFSFQYKGQDAKEFEYNIDGPTEGQSSSKEVLSNGTFNGKIKEAGGMPPKDKPIKILIKWNGQTELFNLLRK